MIRVRPVAHAWQAGWANLWRGLAITRRQPGLYLELCVVYGLPPLVAAWLVAFGPRDWAWYQPLVGSVPHPDRPVSPPAVRREALSVVPHHGSPQGLAFSL